MMILIPKIPSDFVHLFPAYCHPIIDSAGINLIRLNNTANKRHKRISERSLLSLRSDDSELCMKV